MSQVIMQIEKKSSAFIDTIVNCVAKRKYLSPDQIRSKTRKREIVEARQIAMSMSKLFTRASLATIGSEIGGKDHATVLHACKTINNLMDTDQKFLGSIIQIREDIEALLQNFENSDDAFVCIQCGGIHIQQQAWVDPNSLKYVDCIEMDKDDIIYNWCSDCESHVQFITRGKFKESQDEETQPKTQMKIVSDF